MSTTRSICSPGLSGCYTKTGYWPLRSPMPWPSKRASWRQDVRGSTAGRASAPFTSICSSLPASSIFWAERDCRSLERTDNTAATRMSSPRTSWDAIAVPGTTRAASESSRSFPKTRSACSTGWPRRGASWPASLLLTPILKVIASKTRDEAHLADLKTRYAAARRAEILAALDASYPEL